MGPLRWLRRPKPARLEVCRCEGMSEENRYFARKWCSKLLCLTRTAIKKIGNWRVLAPISGQYVTHRRLDSELWRGEVGSPVRGAVSGSFQMRRSTSGPVTHEKE
jgi:hypothetical protein